MSLLAYQPTAAREIVPLSVSQLTAQLKDVIEPLFASVWVVGEISNLSRHRSGHVYFTLKDAGAQLGAILWRSQALRLRFDMKDGLEVIVRGYVNLYEPRGEYRLIVQHVQPKGMGAAELALRQRKEKLQREGVFDPRHKKPLPAFPRRVVLVTSPTGAAVRDLLQVMLRRMPGLQIWIRPVRVQGELAPSEIVAGLRDADRAAADVIVLARGGGSSEDLSAFNEEAVVRAIFALKTPLVSAVGHEIDVTLSDLVADVRALTPSEAGERVAPEASELLAGLRAWQRRLGNALSGRWHRARLQLESLARRPVLARPLERIFQQQRRCDELLNRLARAMSGQLREHGHHVAKLAAALETLSPLKVLARGYSLTFQEDGRTLLTDATMVPVGDLLITQLERGRIQSRVEARGVDRPAEPEQRA